MQYGFRAPEDALRFELVANSLLPNGFSWIEVFAARAGDPAFLAVLDAVVRRYHPTLSVHCRFEDVNPAAALGRVRETAVAIHREDLDFAASISAARAVMHSGRLGWVDVVPPDHPSAQAIAQRYARDYEKHLRLVLDSITELSAYAGRHGIQLTVENEFLPSVLFRTPSQGVRMLVQELESHVPMTLDVGHAVMAGYQPADFVQPLGSLIVHTHLHDNDGLYDMHDPLGSGKVDLTTAIPSLLAASPDVTLLLEQSGRSAEEMLEGRARLELILAVSGEAVEAEPAPMV
jgi:sugar phosphate isomerase/epimerase